MAATFYEKLEQRIEKSKYKEIIKELMVDCEKEIRLNICPEGIPKMEVGLSYYIVTGYDSMRGPSPERVIDDEDEAIECLISSAEFKLEHAEDEFLYYHPEYKEKLEQYKDINTNII